MCRPLTQTRARTRVAGQVKAATPVGDHGRIARLANRLTAPVRTLANAADRLAAGDFEAPVPRSSVTEVRRLAQAFDDMRRALAARLAELAERTRRLSSLQAELIERDRLAATGHLVVQLAHEIRNPVANVRNCLEFIRRRLDGDAEEIRGAVTDERDARVRYRAADDAAGEREAIRAALELTDGVVSRAAELLGMGRTTLWRKMKAHDLGPA